MSTTTKPKTVKLTKKQKLLMEVEEQIKSEKQLEELFGGDSLVLSYEMKPDGGIVQVAPTTAKPLVLCDMGLDISTSVTGVSFFDKQGKLVAMDHIKLNRAKFKTLWDKADYCWTQLPVLAAKYNVKVDRVFVEENAKRFSEGYSSADTILTMAKINGIVSYITHRLFGVDVIDVNVTKARTAIGYRNVKGAPGTVKERVRAFVIAGDPSLPIKRHVALTGKSKGQLVMDAEVADEVDALVICKGGRLLNP